MSLCIRYVSRLVWYAPEVTARATSTAFCRSSTADLCQCPISMRPGAESPLEKTYSSCHSVQCDPGTLRNR